MYGNSMKMAKSTGFVRLLGCGLLLLLSLVGQALGQMNSTTIAAASSTVPGLVANGTTTLPVFQQGSSRVSVIISTPPANATAATGSTVMLTCGISNQYEGPFYWQTYRGSTLGSGLSTQIYTCTSTSTSCPFIPGKAFSPPEAPYNKYTQSNLYGLTIADVDWRDGARYACHFLVGDVFATATVVVIDQVKAQFIEADVPLGATAAPGTLECVVMFGAPIFSVDDQDRSNRMPQLTMRYDGLTYSANVSSETPWIAQVINVRYTPGKPREELHTLRLTVARNLTVADVGKQMTCSVKTISPSFESSTTSTYTGASLKPWDIEIEKPENPGEVVYVDDIVNCSAINHEDAIVTWVPISHSNLTEVESESLVVTDEMIGENVWDCVVRDSRNHKRNTERFAFNVTENPNMLHGMDNSLEEEEARRRVALGVGLGIGLGLPILIVIIVLIVLLMRKRKSGSTSTKNGKPAATAAGGYTPLPAQSDPLPPPIYQPKTNAAPPPRNASPSPSDEPSMNQSGHGDLGGIGLKPASLPSRSSSNLNTSLGGKPLISLGQPDSGPRPSGFADIGGGIGGRPPIPYADSQDSTSAASVPRSISMRSDASSVNPNRSGGPTYRTPQPRTGTATGV